MSLPGGYCTSALQHRSLLATSQQPRSSDQHGSVSQETQHSPSQPIEPAQQQALKDPVQAGSMILEAVHEFSKQQHAMHGDMANLISFSSSEDVIFRFQGKRLTLAH